MAKLLFHNTKNLTLINKMNEIIFIREYVKKDLRNKISEVQEKLDKKKELLEFNPDGSESAKNKGSVALGEESVNDSVLALEKKLKVLEDQRKALNKWAKDELFGRTEGSGKNKKSYPGLYQKIFGARLYDKYSDAQSSESYSGYLAYIKDELVKGSCGIEANDKLVNKFCRKLEHAVGLEIANGKEILNGNQTRTMKSNKFYATFAAVFVDSIKDRCDGLLVPAVKDYEAEVKFDKENKSIISYGLISTSGEKTTQELAKEGKAGKKAA